MFGLTIFLCLVSLSHVTAQGYFPQMAGGFEGMDPFAQQRKMRIEFIDAQLEAAEALPPMQQKQYVQRLNRQKMALTQNNYGYQQQYQGSNANRAIYPTQPKSNNVLIQAPYAMQQYPQTYSGLRPKPQTNVFVIDTQARQNLSVRQNAVPIAMQTNQHNLMSQVRHTRPLQVLIPQTSRFMPSLGQLPQIIIVSHRKEDIKNSPTSQPSSQLVTPKLTQNIEFLPKIQNSEVANKDIRSDYNSGTTMKPQVITPYDVASSSSNIITAPNVPDASQTTGMINKSNSQNVEKKNVNIHGVIDDALKVHIKKKQQALEATLQAQLLAKQKTLEAALRAQILQKHKTLEAALNAEILTKHQSSEAALRDQILKKQRTLESLLKAQMLAKHKTLEAAMEALMKKNVKAAQTVMKEYSQNEQNIPADSRASEKITRSKSQEIKLINLGTQDSNEKSQRPNHQPGHIAPLLSKQQNFGQGQFRPRTVSDTQGFITSGGVNILGTVSRFSRGHHMQANSRLNDSSENKKIQNQAYEQPMAYSLAQNYTTEPTTVQTITSTPKPQIIVPSQVPGNYSETVQESQSQPLPNTKNGDINSSRRIPKLMIKMPTNESSQRNIFQNMKSADRKRLVNYFLRRIARQPQRETSRITRTVSA